MVNQASFSCMQNEVAVMVGTGRVCPFSKRGTHDVMEQYLLSNEVKILQPCSKYPETLQFDNPDELLAVKFELNFCQRWICLAASVRSEISKSFTNPDFKRQIWL